MLLCMTMVVTLFTGCGSKDTSSDTGTNEAKQEENLEDIWENTIVEIDRTEIVLGETTLQTLIDDEWELSNINKFPNGNGSFDLMGSVKKNVLGNKLSFLISSLRNLDKDSDPTEIIIDSISLDYKDFLTANAFKFNGLTLNSTKEEVYETMGIPYVFYSDSYANEKNEDLWLYLDSESDLWLKIEFDSEYNYISSLDLLDYTNADSTISNTVDDTIIMCEEIDFAESNNYVMGEESFKARYPEWFGMEVVVEETPTEELQTENVSNSWDSFNLVIDGVNVNFYDYTTCTELGDYIIENNSEWERDDYGSIEHKTDNSAFIDLISYAGANDIMHELRCRPNHLTLELPCGINQDSTSYEIIEAYGQPTYIYQNDTFLYYYYYTTDYSIKMEIQIKGSLRKVIMTDIGIAGSYVHPSLSLEEICAKEKTSMDKLLMNEGSNYLKKEPN